MKTTIYREHETVANSTHHALIAGVTGSGKSTFINGIIHSILCRNPYDYQMVLIDPKQVELSRYANTQHCIAYADTTETIESTLEAVNRLVDRRYAEMKQAGVTKYEGTKIYVIVDELAEILYTSKQAYASIERLARFARASNVQLVCATQCILSEVIPTRLKMNLDLRVALPVDTATSSRVILGINGAESLAIGEAIIKEGIRVQRVQAHRVSEEAIRDLINLRARRG